MHILFSLNPKNKSQVTVSMNIITVLQKIGKTTFMCKKCFQKIGNTPENSLENNKKDSVPRKYEKLKILKLIFPLNNLAYLEVNTALQFILLLAPPVQKLCKVGLY